MDALAQRDVRIGELEAEKASLLSEMRALEQEARALRRQIEEMKRRLFGSPRCERVSDEQLSLALEELGEEERLQESREKEVADYSRRKSGSASRARACRRTSRRSSSRSCPMRCRPCPRPTSASARK